MNHFIFQLCVVSSLPHQNDLGPNVRVVLVSVMNSGVTNTTKVEFQAAVPKSMRVRLQPPTGRDLPAFNPLAAAPTVIKQVMLIASPSQVGGGAYRKGRGIQRWGEGGDTSALLCYCVASIKHVYMNQIPPVFMCSFCGPFQNC